MLIEVVQHVKRRGGRVQLLWGKVFGQEKNLTTAGIARMNLFLHGVEDFEVVRGDTLRDPAYFVGDELATFDCVIANPPFSLEKWGDELWAADRFGRNFAGIPPKKSGDYAWVEHMVKSMAAKTGRLAVVLPQGAPSRGGAEQRIRRHLLEADRVEAVIGLAPNLFYGTGLAACVMVLRQRKPPERQGKVLVVDASALFKRGRSQNTLEDEHRERIEQLCNAFVDEDGLAHVASLDEISANEFDLGHKPLRRSGRGRRAADSWRGDDAARDGSPEGGCSRGRTPSAAARRGSAWRGGGGSRMSISQTELESYPWGAATVLRGTIDAGDYKQFIFPLLFFKRISDVWDEEYRQALDDSDGDVDYAAFAENHRFQLPDGSHWRDVRAVATNVGQTLQNALRAIEKTNPDKLYGVFGDAQWRMRSVSQTRHCATSSSTSRNGT